MAKIDLPSPDASVFQLEVDALLQELSPAAEHRAAAVEAVQRLGLLLLALPPQERSCHLVGNFAKALDCLMERPVKVYPPISVDLVGGLACGTAITGAVIADVAVQMPERTFDEKDHLNHRYYVKRALFLACVAEYLEGQPDVKLRGWSLLNNDSRRPVLCVDVELPTGSLLMRLLPYAPSSALALGKLAPDRNSVRTVRSDASECALLPTPFYNTGIIEDMMMHALLGQWQTAEGTVPHIAATVRLLKSWARAHGFSEQPDAFNGFLLMMLAVHLVEGGNLTAAMSTAQQFRAIMSILADVKTFKKGLFMQSAVQRLKPPPPPRAAFHSHFGVVFVDASGWLNFAASLSTSGLAEAQQAAALTLSALKSVSLVGDATDAIVPSTYSFASAFDYRYHVSVPQSSEVSVGLADRLPWWHDEARVEALVRQAAGSRATLVRAYQRVCKASSPAEGLSTVGAASILLGVQIDANLVLRALDMGPAADDGAAAKAFQQFWGQKAELRRFPDGRIAEAVVWEAPAGERHLILDSIVSFALRRHLPVGTIVDTFAGCLDAALVEIGANMSDTDSAYRQLDEATTKLSRQLQSSSSLALKITSVQPMGTFSRHTAAFAPQPSSLAGSNGSSGAGAPRVMEVVPLLLTLEASGKWPADMVAFRKVKAALGAQLALSLESSFGFSLSAAESHIDVQYDGFAFRLYLVCNRDSALLPEVLERAEQTFKQRSSHHAFLDSLSARYPALVSSIRLALRWVAAHMLLASGSGSGVAQEAVELLVAAAFSSPSRLTPGSAVTGFVSFLQFLVCHPWSDQPVLVDADASLNSTQRRVLQKQHCHVNAVKPQALRILTSADTDTSPWTERGPSLQGLRRLCAIARKTLSLLEEHFANDTDYIDVLVAFRTPLTAYDALLVLREDALPQAARTLRPAHSAVASDAGNCMQCQAPSHATRAVLQAIPSGVVQRRGIKRLRSEVMVGFDPVRQFVQRLEARYSDVATFFFDSIGGRTIGIKWRNPASGSQNLDVAAAHAQNAGLRGGKAQNCTFAASLVLADMACLGAGAVAAVHSY